MADKDTPKKSVEEIVESLSTNLMVSEAHNISGGKTSEELIEGIRNPKLPSFNPEEIRRDIEIAKKDKEKELTFEELLQYADRKIENQTVIGSLKELYQYEKKEKGIYPPDFLTRYTINNLINLTDLFDNPSEHTLKNIYVLHSDNKKKQFNEYLRRYVTISNIFGNPELTNAFDEEFVKANEENKTNHEFRWNNTDYFLIKNEKIAKLMKGFPAEISRHFVHPLNQLSETYFADNVDLLEDFELIKEFKEDISLLPESVRSKLIFEYYGDLAEIMSVINGPKEDFKRERINNIQSAIRRLSKIHNFVSRSDKLKNEIKSSDELDHYLLKYVETMPLTYSGRPLIEGGPLLQEIANLSEYINREKRHYDGEELYMDQVESDDYPLKINEFNRKLEVLLDKAELLKKEGDLFYLFNYVSSMGPEFISHPTKPVEYLQKAVNLLELFTNHNLKGFDHDDKINIVLSALLRYRKDDDMNNNYVKRLDLLLNNLGPDSSINPEELEDCAKYETKGLEILNRFSKGHQGGVYLVDSEHYGKKKALKIFTDGESHDAFKIAERLDHSNIVKVYDAGMERVSLDGKKLYSVLMEPVEGKTLKKIIQENPNGLDLKEVASYSKCLLGAIENMNMQNIQHCDIKPDNIINLENSNTIKVVDFGRARYIKGNEETKGFSRAYGMATDLAAWGLITYELITGKHLFLNNISFVNSETDKNNIASAINEMLDKSGKLKEWHRIKINQNLPEEVRNTVIKAIESRYGNDYQKTLLNVDKEFSEFSFKHLSAFYDISQELKKDSSNYSLPKKPEVQGGVEKKQLKDLEDLFGESRAYRYYDKLKEIFK